MKPRWSGTAPATAAAVLTLGLTGCGTATSSSAHDPAALAGAGRPTWGGCSEFSTMTVDRTPDAPGSPTVAQALSPYREPGDHVVRQPRAEHPNSAWLLVDDANVIQSSVEVSHTARGWLVMSVRHCAH